MSFIICLPGLQRLSRSLVHLLPGVREALRGGRHLLPSLDELFASSGRLGAGRGLREDFLVEVRGVSVNREIFVEQLLFGLLLRIELRGGLLLLPLLLRILPSRRRRGAAVLRR